MNVDDRTREVMGEILFKTIAIVVREVGQQMKFANWRDVDTGTRANYMSVIEQMISQIPEPSANATGEIVEVSVEDPIVEEPTVEVKEEAKAEADPSKHLSVEESSIIQAVVANHPGIELAPRPPKASPLACQYCGDVRKSKTGKIMHEKFCKMRPAEVVA